MRLTWHIVTGEYPPRCGGVGDYSAAVASALAAAGDAVHVWTPACDGDGRGGEARHGVTLHVLSDAFGRAARREMDGVFAETPGVVLLQYVPNALGARGANLPFCHWFSGLRNSLADVRVMFHEPYFYFTWARPWAPANALALAQRLMARMLIRGAHRVYYSTDTWRRYLPSPGISSRQTLPIPSTIPCASAAIDGRRFDAGHFGTYGAHVGDELRAILPALAARVPGVRVALLGDGGPAFLSELSRSHPELAANAWAPGRLDPPAVAAALHACDLLLQPYPDGITTRRTSVMAGLKNGVATVSTAGELTEPVWAETGAAALAPAGDAAAFAGVTEALLRDTPARAALAQRGAAAYAARFSMAHTIAVLRSGLPA
jgi:hypothetical protein